MLNIAALFKSKRSKPKTQAPPPAAPSMPSRIRLRVLILSRGLSYLLARFLPCLSCSLLG